MRLLVGASLDEGDVEAIRKGHDLKERVTTRLLEHFPDPQDALLRERLEVLAWMVAEGTLEIRVVLPARRPRRADACEPCSRLLSPQDWHFRRRQRRSRGVHGQCQ